MISLRSHAWLSFAFALATGCNCGHEHLAQIDPGPDTRHDAGTIAPFPCVEACSVADAGTPPPEDAGTPVEDAGAPPPFDAGTPPPEDAGAPVEDAGTPPPFDAGTPDGCGPLNQCQWSSMYFSGAHPWMSEPSAAACAAYCNSFSDTVCCMWTNEGGGSYPYGCWAFFDPMCAVPSDTIGWQDPGCGTMGYFDIFWGSVCTR